MPANAATVTVGVGGSEDYSTLKAAIDEFANWRDGSDDTIEVTDAGWNDINEDIVVPTLTALTIKNVDGASPVFRVDTEFVTNAIFFDNVGSATILLEGLTFMGKRWFPIVRGDRINQAVIRIENIAEGDTVDMTVRKCFVTTNKGNNVPDSDAVQTNPGERQLLHDIGKIGRAIFCDGPGSAGAFNLDIEWSTFCHCADQIVTIGHADMAPSTVNVSNTIFFAEASGPAAVMFRDVYDVNVDECLVGGTIGERALRVSNIPADKTVTVTDTVFNWNAFGSGEYAGHPILAMSGSFAGTIVMKRVTRAVNDSKGISNDSMPTEQNPNDGFIMPTANLHLEDAIFHGTNEAALRIWPGPHPYNESDLLFSTDNFTVKNFTSSGFDGAAHPRLMSTEMQPWPNTRAVMQAQFDTCYGGAGPLFDEDPQFVQRLEQVEPIETRGTIDTAVIGIGWDRTTNAICDVRNPAYIDKGTLGERGYDYADLEGDDLAGGADFNYEFVTAAELSYLYR